MSFPPKVSVLLAVWLFAGAAVAQDAAPSPSPWPAQAAGEKIDPADIVATLIPDKDIIMQGEPLYVTLVVKNNSKRGLFLWISDDWIDDKKLKSRKIKLTATAKDGTKLPEFNWEKTRMFGTNEDGAYHIEKIPAAGEFDFRVFVPYWVVFKQPGSYTLTAETKLVFSIPPPAIIDISERNYPVPTLVYVRPMSSLDFRPKVVDADYTAIAVPVTARTAIMVTPPDAKKMDAITGALLKKVAGGELADLETREAGKMLLAIPDERAIPWLARKYREDDPGTANSLPLASTRYDSGGKHGGQIDALLALTKFDNDAALDVLKQAVAIKQAGNDEMWFRRAAAYFLLRSADPGAIPYLLTYIHDPEVSIRNVVLEAVNTRLPPEQALPLLQEMVEKDPSSQVQQWAKMYLERMSKIVRLKQMGLPTPTPYPER